MKWLPKRNHLFKTYFYSFCLSFVLWIFLSTETRGEEIELLSLQAPSQGYFRPGFFYPLALDLETKEAFEGKIRFSVDQISFEVSLSLPAHAQRRVWLYPILQQKNHHFSLGIEKGGVFQERWKKELQAVAEELRAREGWETMGAVWGKEGPKIPLGTESPYQIYLKIWPSQEEALEAFDFLLLQDLPPLAARKMLLSWTAKGGLLVLSQPSWKEAFGLSFHQKIFPYGKGLIALEKLPEEASRRPWVRGRMNPLEDKKLVEIGLDLLPPFPHAGWYLSFLLAYGALIFYFFKIWIPLSSSSSLWKGLFSGFLGVSAFVFLLPRQNLVGAEISILRSRAGEKVFVGEEVLLFKSLSHPQEISLSLPLPGLKPLYFDEKDFSSKKMTFSSLGESRFTVSSQVPQLFYTRSCKALPGTLKVQILSPLQIELTNHTSVEFFDGILIQNKKGMTVGRLSVGEKKVLPISPKDWEEWISPSEKNLYEYLLKRYLSPERSYFIARGGTAPSGVQPPLFASWKVHPLVWIFDLGGEEE